jgi:hypothetical protein
MNYPTCPMRIRPSWLSAGLCLAVVVMAGCFPNPTGPQYPGLYDVTRGTAQLHIAWLAGGQTQAETTQDGGGGGGGELLPIDPNTVPELFRDLAEQWNEGLVEFNDTIDELFPNQVIISYPDNLLIRVANTEDPNDPNNYFQGINGQKGFLAFVAGSPGPGVLGNSIVAGEWEAEGELTGEWTFGVSLFGGGQGGGLFLTAQIVVPYEAVRVAE